MDRPSEDIAADFESSHGGRTAERRVVRKHAILHCHDRVQTVLIRDISTGGMKIQNAFGLAPGDAVRVELLTRRAFEGKVAWAVSPYVGIKFNAPLERSDSMLKLNTPAGAPE